MNTDEKPLKLKKHNNFKYELNFLMSISFDCSFMVVTVTNEQF